MVSAAACCCTGPTLGLCVVSSSVRLLLFECNEPNRFGGGASIVLLSLTATYLTATAVVRGIVLLLVGVLFSRCAVNFFPA